MQLSTVKHRSQDQDAAKPTLEIDPFQKSERLGRPVAPHLFIYQPQITWVISGAFRVTSAAIATAFYGVALTFAFFPATSVGIASALHSLPTAVLLLGKVGLGAPFVFHIFNGIRHLTWDSASLLTLKGVYNTGYAVLGLTAIGTILLAFL